jgi:plasmid stability protein
MALLIPLTIRLEETLCFAVQLRAANCGASASDVVNAILRAALSAEIAEVSSVPPLAAVIQNLHELCRSRLAHESHRSVSSVVNFTK